MNFFNKFNNLKNKNFKTNITKILSITTFGLLFIIMGSSYAYLTTSNKGTLINTVSSGNLELSLDNESSTLELDKAVPQLDEDALENNKEYTFTLSNTGEVLTHYEIYLNSICSITESYTINNQTIKPDLCVDQKYINVGVKVEDEDYTIVNFENNKATLDMGEIWPGEEKNYTVKIWLDVTTPNDYNAYLDGEERNVLFVSKINVIGEQREYRDPEGAYYQIKSQVKQIAISYKYINGKNITIDGITYNKDDNGIFLYDGTDDNGGDYPIYYYRGNVTNNNVLFANMCWKIVRTTSTGGTKLIYNGLPKYSYSNIEKLDESSYIVNTNTPSTYPFTFDSSTKEWTSGIGGQNSTTNTIELKVSEAGDYILNYTVGSEENYDKASFYKNGTALVSNISGANQTGSLDLAGLTTNDVIKVTYTKDGSGDKNGDKVTFSIGKAVGEKTVSCNNMGSASQIGTSKFNSSGSSPASAGYMYGTVYTYSYKNMGSTYWYSLAGKSESGITVVNSKSGMSSTSYYYGDSVTYENGTYTLNNAETHTWSSDYSNFKGYYTFFSTSTSGTSKPYYIVSSTSSYAYYTTYGSEKLGMGKNITYSDGTYTIIDYTLVDKQDYYSNYSSYKGYYICSDNSNSCSSTRYINETYSTYYYYVTLSNGKTYDSVIEDFETNPWVYGNDVKYDEETGYYTLAKTTTSNPLSWSSDRTTLANGYHYTCFNTTGTCSSVYYITYFGSSLNVFYLTFTGGDNLDTAKEKMFANTNDSTIKQTIDNWYKNNLTDYTSYLENTIFCNDRTLYSDPLYSKDDNSIGNSYFSGYKRAYSTYSPSLTCMNQTDRFSLSETNGGTEGYGNNALTYPVGLLTSDEVMLAGGQYSFNSNYYLYTGSDYWLGSPSYWDYYFYSNGFFVLVRISYVKNGSSYDASANPGARPSVSLKLGITFKAGTDGTPSNPYIVE